MAGPLVPAPRKRGRDYKLAFGLIGGIMALAWACSGPDGNDGGQGAEALHSAVVSEAEVAPWPFTVASGTLRCRSGGLVTFEAGGVEYALNGSAQGAGYPSALPVWAVDPQVAGLRLSLRPAIDAGLAMC